MTNREIAQEISNRIGTAPVPFDSVYSIALQIYNELGGEQTQFDSVYSILLEILPLVEGGIAAKVIDDSSISTEKTWSSNKINSELENIDVKPIEEVSELPEASENKDKLFRLDNGEKDVYAAKLLSSETITTNRLPDEQQIDKAYLYNTDSDLTLHYQGLYNIVCTNGETSAYLWADEYQYVFSLVNAEHITENDMIAIESVDDWNVESGNTLSTEWYTLEDFDEKFSLSIIDSDMFVLIPAIYNAPESTQIGNATFIDDDLESWTYVGDETTITVDGSQITGYSWTMDSDNTYITYSTNKASDIYYKSIADEDRYDISDTKFYWNLGEGYEEFIIKHFTNIPQLNAPDSEQVNNAYINQEGTNKLYKGKVTVSFTDSNLDLYLWMSGDDRNNSYFTLQKAEYIYKNKNINLQFADNLELYWDTNTQKYISVYYTVAQALNVFETFSIIDNTISTVKYQRTETTEEWDWEKVATEEYVDNVISEMPKLEAGENVEIADNKINTKGYKYIDNIQAFIENPYSYQRNISEYPLSMLGITELKLTGSANALTYTYSGSGSTAFEQMAEMIITNIGGGLKIESGNYAYLESIDTTNKTVTFKSTLDADNALSNAVVTAVIVKTDFFISGGSGNTTYSYTGTTDIASSLEAFIDKNLYMKFEGYPLVKVIAMDTENETITFDKTLNAESAISNVNFEYGRYNVNDASGINSHVEGGGNESSGNYAHAEGNHTNASGYASHAEGSYTTASGENSHAEGSDTTASGMGSHTEGQRTIASGDYSHAEGSDTKTSNMAEHAEGYNNISHNLSSQTSKQTMSSIGIGDSVNSRNGFEMMHNGDLYIYGVGGYDGVHIKHEQGYESTKTLQEYIASLEARIAALEGN